MALNKEDKADIKRKFGKKVERKVEKATDDKSKGHVPHGRSKALERMKGKC